MIPVRLEWNRPADGVEIAYDEKLAEAQDGDGRYIRPRSDRTIPVTFELSNLENPVVLHFLNCGRDKGLLNSDEGLLRFISRFGFLIGERNIASETIVMFRKAQKLVDPRGGFLLFQDSDSLWKWRRELRTLDAIVDLMMPGVSLRPVFEMGENNTPQLTLIPDSLFGFMIMEIALAFEVGAKIAECERCHKLFLTGSLTGRRSHAKYCSDRCRVAAMRARNAAKGG